MTVSNAFSLTDKVAIITGGGRGIGAGIARAFVDTGAAVALVARTKEQVEGSRRTTSRLRVDAPSRWLPTSPTSACSLDWSNERSTSSAVSTPS